MANSEKRDQQLKRILERIADSFLEISDEEISKQDIEAWGNAEEAEHVRAILRSAAVVGRVAAGSQDRPLIDVLIGDNSHAYARLLGDALSRDRGLRVIGPTAGSREFLELAAHCTPHVAILSETLDEHSNLGTGTLRQFHASYPHVPVIILLESHKREVVVEAFRSGARGIFSRQEPVENLCKCVRAVHEGQIWANSREVRFALEVLSSAPSVRVMSADGLNMLSKRELEVVQCLVQGLTNHEIADHLGLSQHTVKNYLFRIFDKLGVSSRVELLFLALSQSANSGDAAPSEIPENLLEGGLTDEATLASLKNKAEKGSPAAQLALAQSYLSRRSQPDDLVQAYTWFLIATERTSHARSLVTRMLTSKQIDDAQQKATEWLARMQQASVSSKPPAMDVLKVGKLAGSSR